MRRLVSSFLLLLVVSPGALARVRHVPLELRIDDAATIVEGRVVDSTPFSNPEGTLIYTAHRLHVYKALKLGSAAPEELRTVVLVTPGGRLGDELHVVHPSLSLTPGDTGLFFVEVRRDYAGLSEAWVPYAGIQGFVKYRERGGAAFDPFGEYTGIDASLYGPIRERTGAPYHVLDEFDADAPRSEAAEGSTESHSISGLSPSIVRAGVRETLTISGSGFGTQTGVAWVFFDDPDDGAGGSFAGIEPEHLLSWTDTQIEVLVPASSLTAGTGKVIVTDDVGGQAVSPGDLTVEYALQEINSSPELYRLKLENENVRGGYTYRYSTSTASNGVDITTIPDAMDRFEDAIATWSCAAGWNADVDGTTTVQTTGNDGVNIVAFDNSTSQLPAGVLGRATSFYSSCGGDTWWVNGVDIRFARDGFGTANWYYGADPGAQGGAEDDFESVALHELGHNIQHQHINDALDVMYFALTTGMNNRSLGTADINGAVDIVNHSAPFNACGVTGALSFDCAAAPTADFAGSPLGVCGTSVTADFTDLSQNGPTSWSWGFGDSGSSILRNPSHTYNSQGLYTVSVTANNANGGDTETKDNYVAVTDAPVAPSCSPTFTGHDNSFGIGVTNLTLNTINHTTGTPTDGDPLEEDLTCSQFTVLENGRTYPISVTTGSANVEDVHVYIDWDGDGTLAALELAFSSLDTLESHGGNITVPGTAVLGTALRMRVLSDFGPSNIGNACENIEFGQVENYSVLVISAGVPGAVPETSLLLSRNVDPAKIDLDWSPSCGPGAMDYTVHEGAIGTWYSHTSVACTTAGATSLTGLTPEADGRYFLVVPISATDEGSYGRDSSGVVERPISTTTCLGSQDTSTCP